MLGLKFIRAFSANSLACVGEGNLRSVLCGMLMYIRFRLLRGFIFGLGIFFFMQRYRCYFIYASVYFEGAFGNYFTRSEILFAFFFVDYQ